MRRQEPTTIAILGANTVVENALAQLLQGEGYATTVLKTSPLREEAPEEQMLLGVGGGADLVILAPSLSSSQCEAFLTARRRSTQRTPTAHSSPIPVIVLSSPMRETPALLEEEEVVKSVAWPTSRGRLVREIEDLLLEARFPQHREKSFRNSENNSENSGTPR